MAVRRRREPPADAQVDEWADAPADVLEASRRDWWHRYNRVRGLRVNPAPWLAANPFPGARPGERYAHLRGPTAGGP